MCLKRAYGLVYVSGTKYRFLFYEVNRDGFYYMAHMAEQDPELGGKSQGVGSWKLRLITLKEKHSHSCDGILKLLAVLQTALFRRLSRDSIDSEFLLCVGYRLG